MFVVIFVFFRLLTNFKFFRFIDMSVYLRRVDAWRGAE